MNVLFVNSINCISETDRAITEHAQLHGQNDGDVRA